jgi:hypothetical protein
VIDVSGDDKEEKVREALLESDDEKAFRELLVDVCHRNDLLNDVFGRLNDYTELLLPTGLLDREGPIDRLATTDAISDDDYEQVELIGWLYQFYISEKKDEVYDQSGKFEPEDIPAATQIFTPHWIVRYMVENTIGRQWLDKYPDSDLREKMDYLVEQEDYEPQDPIFDDLSELELFDPAAGSGHILVVGFDLLMEMYRERGYTDREAVEQILTENLKGLEIDRRAAQLARFALLMKAVQYDRRALDRDDLRPEVYAMPEPRDFSTSDLRAYLGDDLFDAHGAEVKEALDLIAEHGQNVGSALKLDLSEDSRDAVAQQVGLWDEKTQNGTARLDEQELHKELRGYLKSLLLLTAKYPAVAMNPPYMGSRQMNGELKNYVGDHYPNSKRDLFAVFMEVAENSTTLAGRFGMINQQSWMFLSAYQRLRSQVIDAAYIESMLHLGPGTFDEISGEVVQSTAFVIQNTLPEGKLGTYYRLVNANSSTAKREAFEAGRHSHPRVDQRDLKKIPGTPVAYWLPEATLKAFENNDTLKSVADAKVGITTGDNSRFLRFWPEVSYKELQTDCVDDAEVRKLDATWIPYDKGGGFRKWYGNRDFVIYWNNAGRQVEEYPGSYFRGEDFFYEESITWSDISSGDFGARISPEGSVFDASGPSAFPDDPKNTAVILGILNSCVTGYILHALNPTMHYQVGDVLSIPYAISDDTTKLEVDKLTGVAVQITKTYWDSSETSWDFKQPPLVLKSTPSLEAAYDAWTEQTTDDFFQLHANEEELNDLFIDLYGLEDELSPRVALDDITILEDELDRDALEDLDDERDDLSDEELRQRFLEDDPDDALFKVEVPIRQFLSYGVGVMLGRYRLGHDGLHIAHPNPSDEELAPYDVHVPLSGEGEKTAEPFKIDDDAIVPLMGSDNPFSDDAVLQMREIVRLVWGEDTLTDNLNFINHALSVGRSRGLVNDHEKTMEEWLVGDFWDWHKKLYSVPYYGKKPIYWLFQSPEGHFQALVYMHRMDKFTPQRVRQDYLQRHQQYLRREIEALEAKGEETLTGDEASRLDRLREAAADCREYDAILKDVADQQIEIDLDDGVQNNYPKFGDALADL